MRTKITLGVAAFAAAFSALTFAVTPAYADTGMATIQGAGTISPGLTTTAANQTFAFSGSGPETITSGSGMLTGSCSGPTTVALSGSYTRDAGYALWVITGQISGPINASFTGVCTAVPTSAPTVTSYRIVCTFIFH